MSSGDGQFDRRMLFDHPDPYPLFAMLRRTQPVLATTHEGRPTFMLGIPGADYARAQRRAQDLMGFTRDFARAAATSAEVRTYLLPIIADRRAAPVHERGRHLGAGLRARGIGPGDVVALRAEHGAAP